MGLAALPPAFSLNIIELVYGMANAYSRTLGFKAPRATTRNIVSDNTPAWIASHQSILAIPNAGTRPKDIRLEKLERMPNATCRQHELRLESCHRAYPPRPTATTEASPCPAARRAATAVLVPRIERRESGTIGLPV